MSVNGGSNVNHGKMIVGSSAQRAAASGYGFFLCGSSIAHTDEYKYLGIEFNNGSARGKWNSLLSKMVAKSRVALSMLMFQGGGANGLRPRTMVHQWKAIVRPLLEYGCELWEGEISKSWCSKLEAVQSRFGRATLGTKTFPAAVAVCTDLGLPTPDMPPEGSVGKVVLVQENERLFTRNSLKGVL